MEDGTYLVKPNGDIVNYGERWNYGFFVADGRKGIKRDHATIASESGVIQMVSAGTDSRLVGVWTDTTTGIVYIDPVDHVADYDSAVELGKDRGELAIWDAFKGEEIYLADL